jgi:hypothetical protein
MRAERDEDDYRPVARKRERKLAYEICNRRSNSPINFMANRENCRNAICKMATLGGKSRTRKMGKKWLQRNTVRKVANV